MNLTHGAQTIETYADKRIIKSGAVGTTNVDEIKWLTGMLVSLSAPWKDGWAYIVEISKMSPASPEVNQELVNLHKTLASVGCKALAFVDGGAFFTAAQAREHRKQSNTGIQEGHFKTEAEAMKWIDMINPFPK